MSKPSAAMLDDWSFLLLFVVLIIVTPALFFFMSLPFAFIVLGPLFHLAARLNGAPFHIGDRVRILIGPHRDSVVEIYEIWSERGEVRVVLDEQTKKDVKDVFSFAEVCRENVDLA